MMACVKSSSAFGYCADFDVSFAARVIHVGALELQVDCQGVIVDGALRLSGCRKKIGARQVILGPARLHLDGLVEIGLRLLAVARGQIIAPARAPRLRVGGVGLDCFAIGGNGVVALSRLVRFLAALQGRL